MNFMNGKGGLLEKLDNETARDRERIGKERGL